MDFDNDEQPDISSIKQINEDTDANSFTSKKKVKKPVRRKDLSILKKLIK